MVDFKVISVRAAYCICITFVLKYLTHLHNCINFLYLATQNKHLILDSRPPQPDNNFQTNFSKLNSN